MRLDKSPRTISKMFDLLAPKYDLLNSLITGFSQQKTRKFALKLMNFTPKKTVLDLATGTGDIALLLYNNGGETSRIIGLDLSAEMLAIAKSKAKHRGIKKGLEFLISDASQLPFPDNTFDCCITAFGLRNFEDPEHVIKEIFRVTKKGGKLVIVEAVPPIKPIIRFLNNFYLTRLIPLIAKFFSPNPSAYHYLAQSIAAFLPAPALNKILQKSGWTKTRYFPMLFGTTTVFEGIKP